METFDVLVRLLTEANSPFAPLFNPVILAALPAVAIVAQWLKAGIGLVPALAPHRVTIVSWGVAGSAAGIVVWRGIEAALPWWAIMSQLAVVVMAIEKAYTKLVEPISKSPNPLIPDA